MVVQYYNWDTPVWVVSKRETKFYSVGPLRPEVFEGEAQSYWWVSCSEILPRKGLRLIRRQPGFSYVGSSEELGEYYRNLITPDDFAGYLVVLVSSKQMARRLQKLTKRVRDNIQALKTRVKAEDVETTHSVIRARVALIVRLEAASVRAERAPKLFLKGLLTSS